MVGHCELVRGKVCISLKLLHSDTEIVFEFDMLRASRALRP